MCIYPSNIPSDDFSSSVKEFVNSYNTDTEVLFLGYFNLPDIDWHADPPAVPNAPSAFIFKLASKLKQCNRIYNHRGVLFDLVLSSNPNIIVQARLSSFLPIFIILLWWVACP